MAKAYKKRVLGRGLSAILNDNDNNRFQEDNTINNINEINIKDIKLNPDQPRTNFNEKSLDQLASSINELGLIQPITVKEKEGKFILISGERRLRASKILNLKTIPSYIRIANDEQMLEMALVENIQRDNLNPIDISLSFQRLIKECNLTQEECGNKLGKQRSTITNFLRLLKLPSKIQEGLKNERITVGHARALININDKENQLNIYHDIIESGFSVREVEQIAKDFTDRKYQFNGKGKKAKSDNIIPFTYQKKIFDLSKNLNQKIELKTTKRGHGKIIIPFSNENELSDIFNKIKL